MSPGAAREAARLLAEAGVTASVAASGHDGSVALLAAGRDAWPELLGDRGAELARRIRALGFRYVAIDLATCAGTPPDR